MSLMAAVETLIKREKSSPARVKPETKSSNEILSELFGVFNAAPPDIRETPERKGKKSKKRKKHKKEKKRSRHNSSSSDDSKHRRRKKKIKRQRSSSLCLTPSPKRKHSPERVPKPEKDKFKSEEKIKSEPKVKSEPKSSKKVKEEGECKSTFRRISRDSERHLQISIKNEETRNIPMPDSPHLSSNDLRHTLEGRTAENGDADKTKGKIQIKNLKFSTVFEETVKKAEEEARKKAEQCEEGEYTDTSSSSAERPHSADDNPEFPKSNDPGGILLKKSKEDKKRSISRSHHRSRSKERSHRSRSKDRSHRSRSKERSHRSRSKDRSHRSRSRDRSHRSRSKDRSHRSRSKERSHRSRSKERRRSRSRDRKKSSRRSRSRSNPRAQLRLGRHNNLKLGPRRSNSPAVRLADAEKRRLLEVARKNAINMLKNGAVPAAAAALPPHTRNQVMAAIQSGGKSVDELTDFCKHLSKKEALGELSSVSEGSDVSENEDTLAFHHPFLVRDKAPIIMNIRGGAPLPVKSSVPALVANKDELRMQFPVSSGTQHRSTGADRREWRAVTPPSGNNQIARLNQKYPSRGASFRDTPAVDNRMAKAVVPMNAPPPVNPPASDAPNISRGTPSAPLPALVAPGPQVYPPGVAAPSDSRQVDIGDIVSQKLQAIRQQAERNDFAFASSSRVDFSQSLSALEPSRRLGAFTGAAGANFLTPRELATGAQAWAKKLDWTTIGNRVVHYGARTR